MHKAHQRYNNEYLNIKKIIKKDNPVVIEIGANNGGDATRFIHHFPNIELHCFEADPRACQVFKNNVKYKKCFLYEVAVSDTCEDITFNQILVDFNNNFPEKHRWMNKNDYIKFLGTPNSSTSDIVLIDKEKIKKITVPGITLDKWNEDKTFKNIDYLEIDVQGGEKKVLRGANNVLKKVKMIKIEYGEDRYKDFMSREETLKFLEPYGFKIIKNLSSSGKTGDLYLLK